MVLIDFHRNRSFQGYLRIQLLSAHILYYTPNFLLCALIFLIIRTDTASALDWNVGKLRSRLAVKIDSGHWSLHLMVANCPLPCRPLPAFRFTNRLFFLSLRHVIHACIHECIVWSNLNVSLYRHILLSA